MNCGFFMWKPVGAGEVVDAATLMAGFEGLENNVQVLSNIVQALSVDVRSIVGQQSLNRWMHLAGLFVGVVMCFVMYYKA